jgi:hypothetical protein
MIKRWFTSLQIFLVWLLGFALALIILALGHELLMTFIIYTLKAGRYLVRLVYVVYFTIAGLLCVAYYILIQEFLGYSSKNGRLLKSSLLTIGTEVLLIGLIQLSLLLYGYFPIDFFGISIVIVEGLIGAVMLFIALQKQKPGTQG